MVIGGRGMGSCCAALSPPKDTSLEHYKPDRADNNDNVVRLSQIESQLPSTSELTQNSSISAKGSHYADYTGYPGGRPPPPPPGAGPGFVPPPRSANEQKPPPSSIGESNEYSNNQSKMPPSSPTGSIASWSPEKKRRRPKNLHVNISPTSQFEETYSPSEYDRKNKAPH